MNTNAIRNNMRKVKHPKFSDIGMNFMNNKRKKSHFNVSKHQNSEYIELTDNISSINNKGEF